VLKLPKACLVGNAKGELFALDETGEKMDSTINGALLAPSFIQAGRVLLL
jgi:hypothetical protein